MGSIRTFTDTVRLTAATAFSWLPVDGISNPIFILGCGRSGTTIFGTALSKHGRVTYLNEPRHLWLSAYPQTDIWTHHAPKRQGQLRLTAADADPTRSTRLRRLFRFETIVTRRPVLVEKLPINSFRLEFIRAIFPDARFLHIHRSGLDVARSIARLSENGQWFGANSYKWNLLARHALNHEATRSLPPVCTSFFHKGLLEWRLSTQATIDFLRSLPEHRYHELSYERFVEHPVETIEQVMAFMDLPPDSRVTDFVRTSVRRKTANPQRTQFTEQDLQIGGELLTLSMAGNVRLTRHAA